MKKVNDRLYPKSVDIINSLCPLAKESDVNEDEKNAAAPESDVNEAAEDELEEHKSEDGK